MKTKLSLLLFLLAFGITNAFAHALWIQTASSGIKGQAQEVKVFFGEYEGKETDSTAKWFSNLRDFKLTLTAPDGSIKTLTTVAELLNYKASFTPDQEGTYLLSIVHDVAKVYSKAKIQYYALASVTVGKAGGKAQFPTSALLTFNTKNPALVVNDLSDYHVLYNQSALANKKITIINPAFKNEEATTGSDGKFEFKAIEKGGYFLEAFEEDKKAGKQNGESYEKVWHVATCYVEII